MALLVYTVTVTYQGICSFGMQEWESHCEKLMLIWSTEHNPKVAFLPIRFTEKAGSSSKCAKHGRVEGVNELKK